MSLDPIPNNVVQLHKTPPPHTPGPAGKALARVTNLPYPTPRAVYIATRWWGWQIIKLIPRLPIMLLRELHPIALGLGKLASAWAHWARATRYRADVDEAEGNKRADGGKDHVRRSSGRMRLSLLGFLGVAGATVYLAVALPTVAVLLGLAVVVGLDAWGRHTHTVAPILPPVALPSVLAADVPLGQVTKTLLDVFEREGFDLGTVRVSEPLVWHPDRSQYRITLACPDAIEPRHLRAVERGLGSDEGAVRNLPGRSAGLRELVIRVGDPLSYVPPAQWCPTGSLSIRTPFDLWRREDGADAPLPLSGVHLDIVGTTGSGKSELLQAIITGCGARRDVYPVFADLQRGPLGPLNRRVLQRIAYTETELEALLDWLDGEAARRMDVLHTLAESDDEDAPIEWDLAWGPEIKVIFDEYSFIADLNGKNGKPNCHGRIEALMRVTRKLKITFIRATQKSGNKDLGSTLSAALAGAKILMACTEQDTTTMLSTDHRDQGFLPHLLRPSVEGDARDAGKCYVWSAAHRTPDLYRVHAPLSPGEVKRADKRRAADGLPTLDGGPADTVDAVEVPAVLAEVERAFADAGNPDRMPTAELLTHLAGAIADENELARQLAPYGVRPDQRWRLVPGGPQVRGYALVAVRNAIGAL